VGRKRSSIRVTPDFANLCALEAFMARCDFLGETERLRATLVVSELFDNIVMHSRSRRGGTVRSGVLISVSKDKLVRVLLRYRTGNFAEIIRANRTVLPHFDTGSRRYRGLGLRMCRNLSSSIRFRRGLLNSSIIIIL